MPGMNKEWDYVADPISQVKQTEGLSVTDTDMEAQLEKTEQLNLALSKQKSEEVKAAEPSGTAQWSDYDAQ